MFGALANSMSGLIGKPLASQDDNPTWEVAMSGPHREDYLLAAEKEIETLKKMGCWDTVPREDFMNVLPSTWAFRCKKFPDGSLRKFKGRFCARGDKQIKDVDFFETFCPVVNWTTVRLMLILSTILQLDLQDSLACILTFIPCWFF